MGPTPVYGARAEKPLQNADFAMKQTNICRLSGDIMTLQVTAVVMGVVLFALYSKTMSCDNVTRRPLAAYRHIIVSVIVAISAPLPNLCPHGNWLILGLRIVVSGKPDA